MKLHPAVRRSLQAIPYPSRWPRRFLWRDASINVVWDGCYEIAFRTKTTPIPIAEVTIDATDHIVRVIAMSNVVTADCLKSWVTANRGTDPICHGCPYQLTCIGEI